MSSARLVEAETGSQRCLAHRHPGGGSGAARPALGGEFRLAGSSRCSERAGVGFSQWARRPVHRHDSGALRNLCLLSSRPLIRRFVVLEGEGPDRDFHADGALG